jgi:uncharacterized protein with HEPN domain
MISNAAAKYLWDVQRIIRFATGRSFEDYLADEMFSAAVERQFAIIGEAFVGLRRTGPGVAAIVPNLAKIIGFRNVLVHDYDTVDSAQVWGTIHNDLPPLLKTIEELLRDVAPP